MGKLRQDVTIGHNLKKQRKSANLTQEQTIAKLQLRGSNITRSTYSRYETGELNIKISDLIWLKEIFKCNYDDFFDIEIKQEE